MRITLTGIINSQMDGEYSEEYMELANELLFSKLALGELALKETSETLARRLLKKKPAFQEATNYFLYLQQIYEAREPNVDKLVKRLANKDDLKHYSQYKKLFSPNASKNNPFGRWLEKQPASFKIVTSNKENRKADTMITRVKCLDRFVNKIAERKVLSGSLDIVDYFAIKIVTTTEAEARSLVFDKKNGIYHNLATYGLIANEIEEPLMRNGEEVATQFPGIDNHYDSDSSGGRGIQISAYTNSGFNLEIIVTDAKHFLIDEMEHFDYKKRRENKKKKWSEKQTAQFDKYVTKAKELINYKPNE
ncbi:hypothetical protein HOA91_03765 [Candidatus Woesearchaeota archaeon]|mgnify:CR=1 FL=1|jgi:hypothetical protein|nr:hypothetical protein [Candidatus Woesearchaeota archaeon]